MRSMLLASVASVMPAAFMSDICETVVVKTANGPVRINKADYDADPDAFKLDKRETEQQDEPTTVAVNTTVAPGVIVPPAPSAPAFQPATAGDGQPVPPAPVPPTVPAPGAKLVSKEGRKFFVVLQDGTHVQDVEGIDEKGYATEKAAWEAIMALPH